MLLCQHLGGSHHQRHEPVPEREIRGGGSHQRLSRADITLNQPVHRVHTFHIGNTVVHGIHLSVGRSERNPRVEFVHIRVCHYRSRKYPAVIFDLR